MAAQILAVIIFIVMFGLIIWDHIERHIVSLGCGLLTLVLVFGVCMHSEAAAAETLSLHSLMVPNFWFQTEAAAESSSGINWATILFLRMITQYSFHRLQLLLYKCNSLLCCALH